MALFLGATALQAQNLKIASFNTELSRKGPGLLLRDILRGEDAQINAVLAVIAEQAPDVIALQGFDYDLTGAALTAFAETLERGGHPYPHRFSLPSNAGEMTDLDLDGDRRLRGASDAQGYGAFFGAGGMAILSRYPILRNEVQNFSDMLWRDLPGALLPQIDGAPFPSAEAQAIQRLSSHGHWVVPVEVPKMGRVHLMTFHASPPVFDGPEDRNGKRNHDEVLFWDHYLRGAFGPAVEDRFILLGDANQDPFKGDGRRSAIQTLLNHPKIQDPLSGKPTVNWAQTGPMRVDYVLPSDDWQVLDAGVTSLSNTMASRHGMVWITISR